MENESRGKHKQNISFLRCTAMHRKQTNDLFFLQNLSVAFANFFTRLIYYTMLFGKVQSSPPCRLGVTKNRCGAAAVLGEWYIQ